MQSSLLLLLIFFNYLLLASAADLRYSLCGEGCSSCQRQSSGSGSVVRGGNAYGNYVCRECTSGYTLYLTRCYQNCGAGKFFYQGGCYSCNRQCATCSSSERCDSCSTTTGFPFAYNGNCYQTCPQRTWPFTSGACKLCPTGCASCTSDSYCSTCLAGRYMYQSQNRCYDTCPVGTYGDSNYRCQPCPSSCATCLSSTICNTCVVPFVKSNSQCVATCPQGTYPGATSCLSCPSSCSICSSPSSCNSCRFGYYKKGNMCYAKCPAGSYGDVNYQCQDCAPGCASCTDSSYCFDCNSGYVFYNSMCQIGCPTGTYRDNGRCYDCMSTCETCNGPRSCIDCKPSYTRINAYCAISWSDVISCYSAKPGCEVCLDATTCLLCDNSGGYHLSNNVCYPGSCPTGTYDKVYECLNCPPNCDHCTNGIACTQCSNGFFLDQTNQCVASCPSGYYGAAGTCQICPSGCAACSSSSVCTQCANGKLKSGTTCVGNCPPATYPVEGVCTSCSEHCTTCGEGALCTVCETNYILLLNKCYSSCPDGFYKDSANACQVCNDGCKKCTDANTCTECDSDYAFHQNTCLLRCPEGMYKNAAGVCQNCIAGCRICDSDTVCLQCAVGFVFFEHNCLTTCPDGYYNLDGICTSCPVGCTTCISALSCQSCAFGYNIHETDVCTLDISEKEVATVKQMAKTAEATGTASSVVSSVYGFLNSGDPTAMFMGSLAKMLQYVKYINIEYPPKIKFMFGLQSNLNATSEPIVKKVQNKIEDESDSPQMPKNFGYYRLTSSFVSNCFQSLLTLAGIVFGIGVISLILYWTKKESKVHKICGNIMGVLKWNLFLIMFCGMLGDIAFFSSFEFRRAQFNNAFSVLSFVTCIFMNFLSIYIFYKLIQVNMSLHKTRSETGSIKNAESKWESCKVFYHSYKDKNLSQQSFMIVFLLRVLAFYLIIAYFSAYPLFQIIMIVIVSFFIVLYLIIIRPFKSRLNNVNQIVFEMIILGFNGCVLVLAALDTSKSESFETRKKLETILININLAAGFISTFFIVLKAIVLIVDIYKEWKLAKEAKNPKNLRLQKNNRRSVKDSMKTNNNLNNNNLTTTTMANQDTLFTHSDSSAQNIINLDTMTVTNMNMDQTYDMNTSYINNQSYEANYVNQNHLLFQGSNNIAQNQYQNKNNILPSDSSPSYGYQERKRQGGNQGYQRGQDFIQEYQSQRMPIAQIQSKNPRIKKSLTSTKIKKRPTYTSNVANQILRDAGELVEETGHGKDMENETISHPARLRRRQNRPNHNNNNGINIINL